MWWLALGGVLIQFPLAAAGLSEYAFGTSFVAATVLAAQPVLLLALAWVAARPNGRILDRLVVTALLTFLLLFANIILGGSLAIVVGSVVSHFGGACFGF